MGGRRVARRSAPLRQREKQKAEPPSQGELWVGAPVHYGNAAAALLSWVEEGWAPFWQVAPRRRCEQRRCEQEGWAPFWQDERLDGKLGGAFATAGGMAQGLEHTRLALSAGAVGGVYSHLSLSSRPRARPHLAAPHPRELPRPDRRRLADELKLRLLRREAAERQPRGSREAAERSSRVAAEI